MIRANRDEPLVPACSVKLAGEPLSPEVMLWITNVSAADQLEGIGTFSMELSSRDDDLGNFPWTDDPRFAFGAEIEMSFGYGDEMDLVIAGEITAVEPAYSLGAPPTLSVRGCDKRYRLNTTPRSRTFFGRTDAQIAEEIGEGRNPVIEATPTLITIPWVVQNNQTDLQLLLKRAREIHYQITMRGNTLVYEPVASTSPRVTTLSFADDLLDFRACRSIVPMTRTEVHSSNAQDNEPYVGRFDGRSRKPPMGGQKSAAQQTFDVLGDTVETAVGECVGSQAEADQRAEAIYEAAALNHIIGGGRCFGQPAIRPGIVIGIEQVGQQFSGDYYVTQTTHTYTRNEGYITTFQARRNAS